MNMKRVKKRSMRRKVNDMAPEIKKEANT